MTEENLFDDRSEQDDRQNHEWNNFHHLGNVLCVHRLDQFTRDGRLNQVRHDDEPVLHQNPEPDPFDRVVQVRLDALGFVLFQVRPDEQD